MVNCLYMLFDRVSQSYVGALTIIVNDAVAKRNFKAIVNNPQFPYANMIDDLQLFKLGTINCESGVISSKVEFMCNLVDFKVEVKN